MVVNSSVHATKTVTVITIECATSLSIYRPNRLDAYYLQNGSNAYGTVLDAKKAFDMIDFCN